MKPGTGNQKEKYRHEKTRKVRWMQKFGLVKDAERDGNETEKKEGKRYWKNSEKPTILFTQRTTHDDFFTFSLHSQPLCASSPKYCSSPLPPLLDLPTGKALRLAMLAGSFGPGVCCPQAVLLGTARVRGGRGGPAVTDWEDHFGEDTRYSRWSEKGSIKTQG